MLSLISTRDCPADRLNMSFSGFYDAIASPDLKAVAQHWNEARDTRSIPAWTDISPKRIAAQLPMTWSYTYEPQSDSFTGRLAGAHIDSIFGGNFRGVPMSELYPSESLPILFARSKRVITEPASFAAMAWSSSTWDT